MIIDLIKQAISRLITQYTEAETVKGYLEAALGESNNLEQVYNDLLANRFIDTAVGVNLDIVGSVVGQPRTLIDASQLFFFGFDGAAGASSFGSISDLSKGGRWKALTESTTGVNVLTDEEYRLFIRARIIKNTTRATLEDIIEMVIFILQAERVVITEGDRAYIVYIGKVLTPNERSLISNTDLMPKPIGVRPTYGYFDPAAFMSFGSVNNPPILGGLTFGTNSDPSIGGSFSTLIS